MQTPITRAELPELVKLFPIGPWAGDERMRHDLQHMQFVFTMLRTIALSCGPKNKFMPWAKKHGLEKYHEIATNVDARIDFMGRSLEERSELYMHMRTRQNDYEDAVMKAEGVGGGPGAMLLAMMGGGKGGLSDMLRPELAIVFKSLESINHSLVGLAMIRAAPDIPLIPHFINWTIARDTIVYITSYNIVNAENDIDHVNADGEVIADDEIHAACERDPRLDVKDRKKVDDDSEPDDLHDPTRFYQF